MRFIELTISDDRDHAVTINATCILKMRSVENQDYATLIQMTNGDVVHAKEMVKEILARISNASDL